MFYKSSKFKTLIVIRKKVNQRWYESAFSESHTSSESQRIFAIHFNQHFQLSENIYLISYNFKYTYI